MLGTLLEALVMTVVLAAPTAAVTLAWNPRSTEGEDAVEAARAALGKRTDSCQDGKGSLAFLRLAMASIST